ncbi:MAG: F0F1 ATP synthase subunit beta, partial [Alphaproteobacteria bacterium]
MDNTKSPPVKKRSRRSQTTGIGRVAAISGSVIDVVFPSGKLPLINNALEVEWDQQRRLILEVQQHIDARTIRSVAMHETAALRNGVTV